MSDLQIGLVALGVLLILGVLGFNWWQDRRARKSMQQHFPMATDDPLQTNPTVSRREPEFVGSGDPIPADWVRPDDTQAKSSSTWYLPSRCAAPISRRVGRAG